MTVITHRHHAMQKIFDIQITNQSQGESCIETCSLFGKMCAKCDYEKFDTDWESHIVRTVSRGILCCRVNEQWDHIRKLSEEQKNILEFQKFVFNLKDCDNFGGVLHRNTFQVSRRIGLVGLTFFGPHLAATASYDISITVEGQRRGRILKALDFYNVPGKRGQLVHLTFDMITIEPQNFYNIGFQLDGPKTGILDPDKVRQEVVDFSDDGDRIKFSFLRGSLQMPEMKYVILE